MKKIDDAIVKVSFGFWGPPSKESYKNPIGNFSDNNWTDDDYASPDKRVI